MKEINAKENITAKQKRLWELLCNARFKLSYFQREYRWEYNQVKELIDDLIKKFYDSYKSDDEPSAVKFYGHYFLGSIIISDKDGEKFIIDGQQRLTTLSLILIHIRRLLYDRQDREDRQKGRIEPMIFSDEHNILSFNIDVEERTECMKALLNGEALDETGQSESVVNILARFRDVTEHFPFNESTDILPYFVSWLIDKVYLVEITTHSDDDAYIIFETMNDRGLSLTPTEMLKGYILSNIKDNARRDNVNETWREQIAKLQQIGKMEDAKAIKDWLRSQYAITIRMRKKGATPGDFDLIGTKFHRWVRDNKKYLELSSSDEFAHFIEKDFVFYNKWYIYLRKAAKTIEKKEGLEAVYYCSQTNFRLQYLVLLAPLLYGESDEVIKRKLRIVSAYLDIFIMRRIWNGNSIGHSTVEYKIFNITKEIRGKDVSSLVDILQKDLASSAETFATNDQLGLRNRKSNHIRQILARLTDYIEVSSGYPSLYEKYIQSKKFEIEHIWANHYDRHANEFDSETDFYEYRNRIGGLLLLREKTNASCKDIPYEEKRRHYLKENLLASSLHEGAYERNPGFKKFRKNNRLPFKPHNRFLKNDLNERQELYREIAENVWNPKRLVYEAET